MMNAPVSENVVPLTNTVGLVALGMRNEGVEVLPIRVLVEAESKPRLGAGHCVNRGLNSEVGVVAVEGQKSRCSNCKRIKEFALETGAAEAAADAKKHCLANRKIHAEVGLIAS